MQPYFKWLNRVRRRPAWVAAFACVIGAPGLGLAQQTQIMIDDTRAFPESLTSSADGTLIIGSMEHGTIYRAAPGAAPATPWIPAAPNNLDRVLGVFAHDASNTLWVCTNASDPQGKDATLKSFDLKSGAANGSYPFPDGGLCNDIAVTRDGTTLATDTRGGRILALKPGGTALAVWAADPKAADAKATDPKWVGIDGIAMLTDGSVLFNNVREHQLVRVEAKPDGSAGTATMLELSQAIAGPDGMRSLPDGRIILVENRSGKIDIVRVEGGKATIATIKDGFTMTPTAVTVHGDTAWVTEAKFAYRTDPQLKDKSPDPFSAVAVPVPAQ